MSDPENLLGLGGADVSPSEVSSVQPPVGKLNIKQKVELLETSPTFMGMRYSDQVYARQYALGKLPEFNTLGVSEQTAIRNAVAAMPPAYADKSFENYQKNFESLGAALPYIASSRLANTVVQKGAMAVAGPLIDLVYGKDDPKLKVLKGDPDAAKLHDYLSLKYGSKVAMPEGVRDVINKSILKYIPGVNLLGSDNLADALGDLVGIVGDISATAGGLPGAGVAGVAKAGLLSKAGVASELAVGGKLAASGAKGILPAVATVAAKVVPDAFSGAAFGVGRAAIVDPQAVSDAQGITNTAIGWAVGAAILSSVEGGRDIRSAMTRTNALRRSVSQAYPKMLKENAGPHAAEMYATRQLKSSDVDFGEQSAGVQDHVLVREAIEKAKAKLGPKALQVDPVARLQAQLKVGPLGNRGLDVNMMPNGDGSFRMREVPDAGGQIVTVRNPQRGARPKPLSNITLVEASKETARRYGSAMEESDIRLAKEQKNLDNRKGVTERIQQRPMLPVTEAPRSEDFSATAGPAWKALQEAKRSRASALFDRKGLDEFAGSDIAAIRGNMEGIKETLGAGPDDIIPMAKRAAISEGERQMLQRTEGVKTVDFTQALKSEELSTIAARGTFLDTDNPLRVKPSSGGDSNATGVYSHPMDEGMFTRLQVASTIVQKALNSPVDPLDLAHNYALQAGADAIEHADGSVTLLYPREQAKHVSDFVDPKTGKYYVHKPVLKGSLEEGVDVRAVNKFAGDVKISSTVKATFPNIKEPEVMKAFLEQKTIGELSARDIELLTQTALDELGVPTDKVRVARVEAEPGDLSVKIRHGVGTTTVMVPKKVNGYLEQQAFLKNYIEELNRAAKEYHAPVEAAIRLRQRETQRRNLGQEEMPAKRKVAYLDMMKDQIQSQMMMKGVRMNPAREAVANNIFKAPIPGSDPKMILSWFVDAMGKAKGFGLTPVSGSGLADGIFELSIPGKEAFSGSLDACVDKFLLENTSKSALRRYLDLEGFDFHEQKGKFWVSDRNGKMLSGVEYDDIVSLMEGTGIRPDKISGSLGPDSIEVGDKDVTFAYQGGRVNASLQEALRFSAKFANNDLAEVVGRTKSGAVISKGKTSGNFILDWKEMGLHREFKSAQAAYKFLNKEMYDIHNLIVDAENKGFVLYREDGNYVLSDQTGRHVVESRPALRKLIASVPDSEWAPSLLGPYDTRDLATLPAPSNSPFVSPIINPLRKWGHLSAEVVKNYLQPAMSRFKDMADYYHMPEVNEKFARLRTAVKISEHQMMLVTNYTAEVLKGYDGKGMDANESARFMEYMEANREDVKGRILKDLFEDNTSSPAAKHFLGNVEKTRDILGRTPTTGMFATLGLESSKFEVSWMTRLMKKIAGDPTWANKYADMGDAGAQAMMRDLYANNVPKQLDFQSRYMRVSDFVDLARDINSLRALTNYYRQGLFWLYAGPALEEFYNATHTENTPAPLRLRADHYIRVTIAGVKNDLAGVNAAVIRELGMMSSDGKDAANLILNLGTAGIFIGKPWSAVRQVFDAYASAAPILGGNRFLDEGFRWANKEYKKNLQGGVDARYLNERLQTSEPTARGERFLGWYFTKSHSLVQGGDVLPRMAIYRAGQLQFERGMEVMAKNPALRIEDALYSWPYLTNPEQVQAAWLREDYAAAKHVFADNLQEQTSGSFRPQDQGMLRNSFGFFGRAWGQLMTMVMQMNDLRLRVLTKGTPGQRVLTTSIMAKNMAMIAAGLNIAGVDGSSFLPWSDLTVSGGPVFNEMLQIVMLTQGDAAERSRRLRILAGTVLAQTVPFETLLQRAVRTVDFMGKKQYWKAMLAVTATPIAKGSYVNMLTGKPFMEKPPKKE